MSDCYNCNEEIKILTKKLDDITNKYTSLLWEYDILMTKLGMDTRTNNKERMP